MLKSRHNIAHLNKSTRDKKKGVKGTRTRTPLLIYIYLEEDGDDDYCTPEQLEVAHARKEEPGLRQIRPQEVEDGRDAQRPQNTARNARRALRGCLETLKWRRTAEANPVRGLTIPPATTPR